MSISSSVAVKIIAIDLFGVLLKDTYKAWYEERTDILNKSIVESNNKTPVPYPEYFADLIKNKGYSPTYPQYLTDLIHANEEGKIKDHSFYSELSRISGETEESLHKMIHASIVNEGIVDLIIELKSQGHKIGLLTNAQSDIVEELLKINKFDFFDFKLCAGDKGVNKTNEALLNSMMSYWLLEYNTLLKEDKALLKQKILLIDESPKEVEEFKKLGFPAILFQGALVLKESLRKTLQESLGIFL